MSSSEVIRMKRPKRSRVPEIHSDDEVSDSDVINETDKFHEKIDTESALSDDGSENIEYAVGDVKGRDESDDEDDQEDDESDSEVDFESESDGDIADHLPSTNDFGANTRDYYQGQPKSKKSKREKKTEAEESMKAEAEDALDRKRGHDSLLENLAPEMSDDEDVDGDNDETEKAMEDMNSNEKVKLLKRQSPLLFPLVADFKHFESELTKVLLPLAKILDKADEAFQRYTTNRLRLVRCYLLNITFFLRLRSKATPNLDQHPVVERLAQLRQLIDKTSSDKAQDYSKAFLEAMSDEKKRKLGKVVPQSSSNVSGGSESEDGTDGDDDEATVKVLEIGQDGKRRYVNRKIEKNVGLHKSRQKKRRNPRVKHRLAYEDAKKRRKGAIRTVITDQKKKYTGEQSGIRAGIKKSVRIKS